jgi:hypothetical protein
MSKQQPEVWKKKLLDALERSLGVVSPACNEVGISRDRFYTYYNEDETFRKRVDEIQNYQLDFVENQLFNKIREGSEKSILFYMRFKGKNRGYVDRQELEHKGEGITINIVKPKKDEDNKK